MGKKTLKKVKQPTQGKCLKTMEESNALLVKFNKELIVLNKLMSKQIEAMMIAVMLISRRNSISDVDNSERGTENGESGNLGVGQGRGSTHGFTDSHSTSDVTLSGPTMPNIRIAQTGVTTQRPAQQAKSSELGENKINRSLSEIVDMARQVKAKLKPSGYSSFTTPTTTTTSTTPSTTTGVVKPTDEEENLLQGINRYRATLNLTALVENNNAECFAGEIADQFKNQPCTNTTGSNTVPGTEIQFSNYPTLLTKCHLNITNTKDGVIMPACVPNLDPTLVLSNFTQSQYSGYLNDTNYSGAGIGSEGNWIVIVLSTNTSDGSFVTADKSAAADLVAKDGVIYYSTISLCFSIFLALMV
ncbi:hypothetical protein GIB67_037494 [Kingdonia uniflora]|uniref:Uncharacterized GPI-anchored protein At5g19230-like domain-containing protein n=1 Tax=Kingdonia uniflora TaxID=39325 RepID=A0A7J7KXA8_9MAGN|nr:hypothetical protein GIB67_037494 [Kingdonia uniflora]